MKLLAGYRNRPAAKRDAIYIALMGVAQLVSDIPEIQELDVNLLLADEHGVIAVDARISTKLTRVTGPERLAIRPYPKELEEEVTLQGRPLKLRPIRPEDEPQHREFFSRLDPEDVRFRFFRVLRTLQKSEFARLTQIDYDREMAFIATRRNAQSQPETVVVVRAIADPDNARAEFAIIVRSDLKGHGLGSPLNGGDHPVLPRSPHGA